MGQLQASMAVAFIDQAGVPAAAVLSAARTWAPGDPSSSMAAATSIRMTRSLERIDSSEAGLGTPLPRRPRAAEAVTGLDVVGGRYACPAAKSTALRGGRG